ncbi:hypothetical protein [Pectobacterium brasiliense]|uniref:hypothetical protein n=1 Tax=Pectobacterium brasiliense TaxID=180957 RepID=UPI0038733ED5
MKRKITWRNKQHLTRLLGMAVQWDLPLSSVVNFSTGNAESKNASRLARAAKSIVIGLSATGMMVDARKSVLRMWGFCSTEWPVLACLSIGSHNVYYVK